jgi:APA family basic amino acid/polyamine antiporter
MTNKLKKQLDLKDITIATIGYVIGAGIYAVIGISSKYSKNFTWLSIVLCGIFAVCTGLSFSELSAMFDKNGGEYIYAKEAFDDITAKAVGIITFTTEILSIITVSIGLGNYLSSVIPLNNMVLSAITNIFLGYINYSGIRKSVNYNNVCTILEIGGLILISILGMKNYNKDMFDISTLSNKNVIEILVASSLIYFSYFGFDVVIELTEETIDSKKTIPRGIMNGIAISTILYIFVSLSAVSTVGWETLSKSKAPIVDVARALLGGNGAKVLLGIAVISMSNTLLMGHIGCSRFINSVSKYEKLPFYLDKVDPKTRTPKNSIIFITVISIIGLLIGNIENAAIFTNISTMMIFIIVNLAVIQLRITKPEIKRPYKIPFNIKNIPVSAIIGFISNILLLITLIVYNLY